jgi:hypothetical protein
MVCAGLFVKTDRPSLPCLVQPRRRASLPMSSDPDKDLPAVEPPAEGPQEGEGEEA